MEQELDGLRGQLSAVSTLLVGIIAALPNQIAEQAAEHVRQELGYVDQEAPEAELETRNAILSAYLEMLETFASRE